MPAPPRGWDTARGWTQPVGGHSPWVDTGPWVDTATQETPKKCALTQNRSRALIQPIYEMGCSKLLHPEMPVSLKNSQVVYEGLKKCGIGLVSALPETWLVHLIRMAEDDPKMILVRLAKEEEGVGISAGAHFAGVKSAMLMQNHGFLASING